MAVSSATQIDRAHERMTRRAVVALMGNPNCGKSTLFHGLTGFRQRVGNYPGVTVEKRVGLMRRLSGAEIDVLDLPGCYSLAARSLDEQIVGDVLFDRVDGCESVDAIVVVVDASNLQRHMFLLGQLLETGLPVVVALNMIDLAEASGVRVDAGMLAARLGVEVVPTAASKRVGLEALSAAIENAVARREAMQAVGGAAALMSCLPKSLAVEVDSLGDWMGQQDEPGANGHFRNPAERIRVLLDVGGVSEARFVDAYGSAGRESLLGGRQRLESQGIVPSLVESESRYRWAGEVLSGVVQKVGGPASSKSDALDRVLTHRVWGLLVFVGVLGVVFQAIYTWAGPLMDGIEAVFGALGGGVRAVLPEGPLASLLADGIIAGVGSVLVFLPQILILFFFIAVLEDCGYLARGAFLMDRWLRRVGLSGRSFIPLLSSFACAIPGIMATRTIESRSDRFVTMLVAPLMSCSARLPVYVLLIGAFVPATTFAGGLIGVQGAVLLAMYCLGIVVAIPVALLAKWMFFRGESQPFLLELPSYKWPSLVNVIARMYESGKAFALRAGTVIFAVTVIIWAMGYFPRSGAVVAEHAAMRADAASRLSGDELTVALDHIDQAESGALLRSSMLGRIGQVIEPVVRPLGWDWRIGTAVIASFPAREVVIATMGTIYNLGNDQDEESGALRDELRAAAWPDGSPVFTLPVALSIMVFFALCCQCGATLAVMKKETNSWRWPTLTFGYMTALAYVAALATYRVGEWLT